MTIAAAPRVEPASEVGTSIELFTGGGGLAVAMHRAGFRHLLAVEIESRACATLLANKAVPFDPWATTPTSLADAWPLAENDIHHVDFTPWAGQVDVVAGGVPCQPWSLGGVHKGYDDKRNLWPELFRCVRETRPRAIIAENVKGLLRPSFREYYGYILRELAAPFEERVGGEDWRDHNQRLAKALEDRDADLGRRYDVRHMVVNVADYGVPQIRFRVFVVAFRRDLGLGDWQFPAPTHSEAALLRATRPVGGTGNGTSSRLTPSGFPIGSQPRMGHCPGGLSATRLQTLKGQGLGLRWFGFEAESGLGEESVD